jgi:hypothetical protein
MSLNRFQKWHGGALLVEEIEDDASEQEIALRNALDAAIATMQTIQSTNIDTINKANIAIHAIAEVDEKLLKWIKRKVT